MAKISIYNLEGKAEKELAVPEIFAVKDQSEVLSQAIIRQMANRRRSIAHTKTRGEVSGGGKKPFKQKGTGNARAGSTRSPLWTGGGITFGPRNVRNFSKRMPQKMLSTALKMVLADKIKNNKFIVLNDLTMPKISTKQMQAVFEKLPIEEGKILVILPKIDINTELSLANISYAKVIKAENINVLDLLKNDYIVTSIDGFNKIEAVLTGKVQEEKVAK